MDQTTENWLVVKALIDRAEAAGLQGLDFVEAVGLVRAVAAYNGIGPEFLPATVRAKVSYYLALFAPAAFIHDCRYGCLGDRSPTAFNSANREFMHNCLTLADREYAWWNWRRYRARAVAVLLGDFVSSAAGWTAWCQASQERESREEREENK